MTTTLDTQITAISQIIDDSNQDRDLEARTWGRLAKVNEEGGEVIKAFIGATGQNPRKGFYADMGDVADELLDTALTALAAWEHVDGNQGRVMSVFENFVAGRYARLLAAMSESADAHA